MTNDHLTAPEIDVLSRTVSGIILGIGALAAFSVVVSPFRDDLNTGTIALILLVPVLISTVGGIAAALVVAALGAATFNFFFTQPYHSFRIDSGESIAALAAYIVVAVVVAVMASLRRDAVRLAGDRSHEAQFLHDAAADIATGDDTAEAILTQLNGLRYAAQLEGVHLVTNAIDAGEGRDGRAREAALSVIAHAEPSSAGRAWAIPLDDGATRFGALGADPGERTITPDQLRTVESFARLVQLALRASPSPTGR